MVCTTIKLVGKEITMTLKQYIKDLQEIAKNHKDLELVYAIDDEGNSYRKVNFGPSVGSYDANNEDFLDYGHTDNPDDHEEVVCIN